MQHYDLEIKMLKIHIKSLKHSLMISRGLFLFNLIMAAWEGYNMYISPLHALSGIGLGILACNTFWVLFQTDSIKRDLKYEIENLKQIERLNEYNNLIYKIENNNATQPTPEKEQ